MTIEMAFSFALYPRKFSTSKRIRPEKIPECLPIAVTAVAFFLRVAVPCLKYWFNESILCPFLAPWRSKLWFKSTLEACCICGNWILLVLTNIAWLSNTNSGGLESVIFCLSSLRFTTTLTLKALKTRLTLSSWRFSPQWLVHVKIYSWLIRTHYSKMAFFLDGKHVWKNFERRVKNGLNFLWLLKKY